MSLKVFEILLRDRIGLNVKAVGTARVADAVRRRMASCRASNVADYAALLRHADDEFHALVDEVVVPETWFFRDATPFEALRHWVRGQRSGQMIRILSMPCASGEEPYSIAMQLLEAGVPAAQFHIDACDISRPLLERAQRGTYGRYSFRGTDRALVKRYFTGNGGAYTVTDAVRERVRFHHANLLGPDLGNRLGSGYDVIFCRNLMIYFDGAAKAQACGVLHELLRPDGVLVLGHAEATPFVSAYFEPAGEARSLMYRRIAAPAAVVAALEPLRPVVETGAAPPREASYLRIERLTDEGRLAEAGSLAESLLRAEPVSDQAYFALGLVRHAQGRKHEAVELFRKAVYLQPDHAHALDRLVGLADELGDEPSAQRFRHRFGRVKARKAASR